MSLLDGLKEQLKNPLADNNEEIEFALESDFEVALEKAIDVKLSPADIAAILNGDDDIDDDEDDLDDPDDDIDKNYIKDLEGCKEALESTMTELGIDTAADELDADDSDLEMDPEEDDEVISEEALLAKCEALLEGVGITDTNDAEKVADTGDASIPKNSGSMPDDINTPNHDTGDPSIPENTEDPTPDGIDEKVCKLEAECEALLAALEGEEYVKPEVDKDPDATECSTETGSASVIANTDDPTPDGDKNDPSTPVDNETKDEKCGDACESKKEDSDDDSDDDESDDDEDEKKDEDDDDDDSDKDDDKSDKDSDDDESDDDEDEKKDEDEDDEPSLESILDDLLSL